MTDAAWVWLANAAVWLGVGLYLARLRRAQVLLAKRLKRLEDKHV